MAKGVESLTDEERSLIENYFNLSLDEISQASESLDDRSPNLDLSNAKDKLDVTLDILEALWSSQALQERHFDSWMINLNNLQQKEVTYCITSDK